MNNKIIIPVAVLAIILIAFYFINSSPKDEAIIPEVSPTATSTPTVTSTSTSQKLPGGSAPIAPASAIQGKTWTWVNLVERTGASTSPKKADAFSITLGTDGNLVGKTDCNGFFGSYQIGSDGVFTVGQLGSTLMFCEGSQEQVFTNAISKVQSYNLDAQGNLVLTLEGNVAKMTFKKK